MSHVLAEAARQAGVTVKTADASSSTPDPVRPTKRRRHDDLGRHAGEGSQPTGSESSQPTGIGQSSKIVIEGKEYDEAEVVKALKALHTAGVPAEESSPELDAEVSISF